ncbi:CCHC-type domain-containing protein [Aphis craccivora]|uniref:CCHC-type domain-containing protein n=1 Tax=Aphis craccivora TaxID=307492 RepID=A0A6G0VPP4_APHCR|nr:CCHC-type domain-containing protein [Aphis craccivora]
MGEPHTNPNRLNEKLIASSKVSTNKQNVTSISKTGHSVVIVDNAINEPLLSQHSDNDYNSDAIKTTDKNIPNHDSINKINHIQRVHNTNSSSQQNTNNDPEKYAFGKKSFAETTLNSTLPKKEHAILEYIIAISKLTPPKNIKFASRITNNRFCIYLNDKNTVDFLVDNHPYIIINSHTTIKIRR